MHSAYLVVIILAAAANIYAGICDFTRPNWLLANIKRLKSRTGGFRPWAY